MTSGRDVKTPARFLGVLKFRTIAASTRIWVVVAICALAALCVFAVSRRQLFQSKSHTPAQNDNALGKTAITAQSPAASSPAARPSIAAPVSSQLPQEKPATYLPEDDSPNIPVVTDRPRFASAVGSPAPRKAAAQADVQLQKAASSLRDYRSAFSQNPVGTNAEITSKLSGKNPRGARYLPANAKLNDKGEMTDRWDRPLFFHQISGSVMEIRSAGPDHVMWTNDDEVLR